MPELPPVAPSSVVVSPQLPPRGEGGQNAAPVVPPPLAGRGDVAQALADLLRTGALELPAQAPNGARALAPFLLGLLSHRGALALVPWPGGDRPTAGRDLAAALEALIGRLPALAAQEPPRTLYILDPGSEGLGADLRARLAAAAHALAAEGVVVFFNSSTPAPLREVLAQRLPPEMPVRAELVTPPGGPRRTPGRLSGPDVVILALAAVILVALFLAFAAAAA
ncbi:hypothetical protein [Phaeovulum vinaykumarii]|uniref:Uncharacterized protein n=1 Tax=Phaeovulum vinaykumarii TaxID=407234 RepID=A0A1N7KSG5_9RHOB|nr:hypothetical protein [Phaeovulum vinaykumarii]SIS64548.1 hypothetical protein SAMN05421795_102120 [Phaeovulum vinaykumarii]SOC01554.1 hypothetical protein SAMN05878426_102654 [Phaeovulum vinaykumarii]